MKRSISIALLIAAVVLAAASLRLNLPETELQATLLSLRKARLMAAMLAGAALSVGGVLVQALFRNPLADPSILGTTAGATLGAELTLILAEVLLVGGSSVAIAPDLLLPVGALLGALLSLFALLALFRITEGTLAVLLMGLVLTSFFMSIRGIIASFAHDRWELGRALFGFSLGGVSGAGYRHVALAAPLVIIGIIAAWAWGRRLDILLSGDNEATALGVDTVEARRWCTVWVAILTAAAIAIGGGVGFVGLIVPHLLRRFIGASHRALIPLAAMGGAVFVMACDLTTRLLPTKGEGPLGVVTGFIGAPIFLALFVRQGREGLYE